MPNDATAAVTVLTCGCGYNLHGLDPAGKCPECGDPIDIAARRLKTRSEDRLFVGRVSLGIVIVVSIAPLLAAGMLIWRRYLGIGLPLAGLNFAGPKVWAAPVISKYGNSGLGTSYLICALVVLNAFGVWLLTTPHPRSTASHPPVLLRRTLRAFAFAGVAVSWVISEGNWTFMEVPHQSHALVAVLVAELPCTVMLYLYLERLAQHAGSASLARQFRQMMWAATAAILVALPWLTGSFPTNILPKPLIMAYGIAVFVLGFVAADLLLKLRHEIGEPLLSPE